MRTYRLAPRTYACVASEGAVFLDVSRDAYVGIDRNQAAALAALVEDWPESQAAPIPIEANHERLADELCARGLLVRASVSNRRSRPPPLPMPRHELVAWDQMSAARTGVFHVIAFLVAFLVAQVSLRLLPLRLIVRRYERSGSAPESFDVERARRLVSVYHNIRVWVFARKGKCMLDSLTLLHFLSLFGVRPCWVIGVQLKPFGAHSWLQHGEWVLNGTPVFVRAYTPILVL